MSKDKRELNFANFKKLTRTPHFNDKKSWAESMPKADVPIFTNKHIGLPKLKYVVYLIGFSFLAYLFYSFFVSSMSMRGLYINPWINIGIWLFSAALVTLAFSQFVLFLGKFVSIKYSFKMYKTRISFFDHSCHKIRLNIDDLSEVIYYPMTLRGAYFKFKNFYGDQYSVAIRNYPDFLQLLKLNKHLNQDARIKMGYGGFVIHFVLLISLLRAFAPLTSKQATLFDLGTIGSLILVALFAAFKFFSRRGFFSRSAEISYLLLLIATTAFIFSGTNLSSHDRLFFDTIDSIAYLKKQNNVPFAESACGQLSIQYSKIKLPQRHQKVLAQYCGNGTTELSSQARDDQQVKSSR